MGVAQFANADRKVVCLGPKPPVHCFNHPMSIEFTFTNGSVVPMTHDGALLQSSCGWPPYTLISNDFAVVTSPYTFPSKDQSLDLFLHGDSAATRDELSYKKYAEVVLHVDANSRYTSGVYKDSTEELPLTCTDVDLKEVLPAAQNRE